MMTQEFGISPAKINRERLFFHGSARLMLVLRMSASLEDECVVGSFSGLTASP